MKSQKKSGFTLVELLVVIVILSIILAISIPGILGIVEGTTRNAFVQDANMVLKQLEYEKLKNDSFDITTIDETNINNLNISNANYQDLQVGVVNNKPYIMVVGKSKWNELKVCGTRGNMVIASLDDIDACEDLTRAIVNPPVLAPGMTPIKWDGTTWIDTNETDWDWYSYGTIKKEWANARTADGSMWVWIPRYAYKISSGWHSNTTGTIEISFSKGTDDTKGGTITLDTGTTSVSSDNKWTSHPAFTFGSTELTGIWVAKFEATASEGVANSYTADGTCPVVGDDVTTKTVKLLPNVEAWRCISANNTFVAIRNMETKSVYGWPTASGLLANGSFTIDTNNIDTHLIKNVEWGAVAYLSKSQYGKSTEEIYKNNNQNYITGCAGDTVTEGGYNGCRNTYESAGGVLSSTTGTIYGIYDLSGSTWERTSSYVNNANENLDFYGSNIITANSKYKDIYTVGGTDDQANNYGLALNKKGDALYETSGNISGGYSWFGDSANMPNVYNPWFMRGGGFTNGSTAGVFYFHICNGSSHNTVGFRPILIVGAGL